MGGRWGRRVVGLPAGLTLALGLRAMPAAAQVFGYMANQDDSTVSVLATANHSVVAPVPLEDFPIAVREYPRGDRVIVVGVGSV
jgi:YVTN family beta-propeller protein